MEKKNQQQFSINWKGHSPRKTEERKIVGNNNNLEKCINFHTYNRRIPDVVISIQDGLRIKLFKNVFVVNLLFCLLQFSLFNLFKMITLSLYFVTQNGDKTTKIKQSIIIKQKQARTIHKCDRANKIKLPKKGEKCNE